MVRYVAVVALAIWVGGTMAPFWRGGQLDVPLWGPLAYACGATELVSLFVLKFVGPPPRAFPVRAALVVFMIAVAAYANVMRVDTIAPALLNVAAGLILLSWHAHE